MTSKRQKIFVLDRRVKRKLLKEWLGHIQAEKRPDELSAIITSGTLEEIFQQTWESIEKKNARQIGSFLQKLMADVETPDPLRAFLDDAIKTLRSLFVQTLLTRASVNEDSVAQYLNESLEIFDEMLTTVKAGPRDKGMVELETDWEQFEKRLNFLIGLPRHLNYHADIESFYHQILQLALKLIPHAEAGSLLVLEDDKFKLKACIGYDYEKLKDFEFFSLSSSEKLDKSSQLQMLSKGINFLELERIQQEAKRMFTEDEYAYLKKYGRIDEIKYTLSVLLVIHEQPFGFLNLDSFSEEKKFSYLDKLFVDLFAQQISAYLENYYLLKKVEESEKNYRTLFERSPMAIYIHQDDKFKLFNPKFLELLELTPEEARQVNVWQFVHPDDLKKMQKRAAARLRGKNPLSEYEFRAVTKSGKILYALGSFTRVEYNGRPAVLGEIMNITRLRLLEQQLWQSQKMETLGTLTAGIAHDFNNFLAAIIPSAQMIVSEPTSDKNIRRAEIILQMAQRGASLTQQLLAFARTSSTHLETLNLNDVLKDSRLIIEKLLDKKVQLKYFLQPSLPSIQGNPTQIMQMVMNLVLNARDALPPEGGVIKIRTKAISDEPILLETDEEFSEKTWILLEVSDNGVGIPPEIQHKIFDPFFTTKTNGKGSGLGLSTVYSIVTSHQGRIHVESTPGKGTTFYIYFPVSTETAEQTTDAELPAVVKGEGLVMVVDDEEPIREILKNIISGLGYEVETFKNGQEALSRFREAPHSFDLIILDYKMPGLNGREVFERMKQIHPSVNVVLCTGFSDAGDREYLKQAGIKEILKKPFTVHEISQVIQRVLLQSPSH